MRAFVGVVALAAALAAPAAVHAHAQLIATSPARGAVVERAPAQVSFTFNEPVEASFGAVRVFDAAGRRQDDGELLRPGGSDRSIGTRLRASAPDGAYTATFRLVSADGHPVAGGFQFSIGTSAGAPARSVADLVRPGGAGPVTTTAFGVVRAIEYAAIAVTVGGALFLIAVWLPGLGVVAGSGGRWPAARRAFARRATFVLTLAIAAGAIADALGLAFQAAIAGGTSLWSALDAATVREVLDTRTGAVWGLRLLVWIALGALLAVAAARGRLPALRPAALGAAGLAAAGTGARAGAALALLLGSALVVSPALGGHAGATSPLLVLAGAVHVAAMSAWVGCLTMLVLAVPAATRRLEPADRTRLLAANLARVSPLALGAVAALLATGIAQAVAHLTSVSDLADAAFGRAVLAKAVLLCVLIALGAAQRRRVMPQLDRLVRSAAPPRAAGRLLRRLTIAELGLFAAALAVTAALVSYPPPGQASGGPASATKRLGPLELQLTVEPATAGANTVHLYLLRAADGVPFSGTRELRLAASLPAKQIGPLRLRTRRAGPGHYIARGAVLAPAGRWRLTVGARVSEFDAYERQIDVRIR